MYSEAHAKMIAQLKRDEGAVRDANGDHVVYVCPAGKRTIGYGHNLDANPISGNGKILTEDQAERLLQADVLAVMQSLEANLAWAGQLDPPRYAVLVNMAFNMGVGGLLGFKKSLGLIKDGKYAEAAASMRRSKWFAQVGRRAERMVRQMETGRWQ